MLVVKTSEASESQCPFQAVTTGICEASAKKCMRPPLIIGPVRQGTGDVLPFLAKTRKTYGDALRMRMFGIELTCLCGHEETSISRRLSLNQ